MMRFRKWTAALGLILWLSSNFLFSQDSAADYCKAIEAVQHPNRQGLDPFTIEEIMVRYGIPGISIAVIKDFKIDIQKHKWRGELEPWRPELFY
jgi:hypothetical protein